MRSQHSYLALALLALAPCSFANPVHVPHKAENEPTPTSSSLRAAEIFQHLLSMVDPSSLHEALHAWHPKYTDGAFASDMSAAVAIHKESPALATAILELARRQDSSPPPNSTNSESTPTQLVTTRLETLTPSPTTPVVVQTTTLPQTVVTATFAQPSSSTPSLNTIPTSASVVVRTSVATSSVAAATTTAVPAQTTPSVSQGSGMAMGSSTSIYLTTYTPPGGGQPTTITSLAIVGISGRPDQPGISQTQPAASPSPSLRNAGNRLHLGITMPILLAILITLFNAGVVNSI